MKIEKLEENYKVKNYQMVRVKEMGNVVELMFQENRNNSNVIKKISANEYIDTRTGEVKEFIHIENRSQAVNEVRKSLGRLRDYINTNVTDVECCKWITLTYAENMTDTKRLYEDFKKFNMRMRYALSKEGYKYEYIVAMEPQGRGAWHAHMFMIFDCKAPYIDNDFMAKTWSHGFTSTKKLDKNIDNLGAYLTAYLGDMELTEAVENVGLFNIMDKNSNINYPVVEVEVNEGDKKVSKAILKGLRMVLYPPKFNLYRCSRGIKKPIVSYEREIDAQKKISAGTLTFERTIKLTDADSDYSNVINYRYYNRFNYTKDGKEMQVKAPCNGTSLDTKV